MTIRKFAVGAAVIGFVGLSLGFSSGLYAEVAKEVVLQDRWALKWTALDVARKSQDLADNQWSAMVGINATALDTLFDGIEGASLTNTSETLLKDTEIVVGGISLNPGIGSLDATIELSAKKGPFTLGLALEGSVVVTGIVNTEREVKKDGVVDLEAVTEVSFRIEPTRVTPSLGSANLERAARRFWTELAPGLASALLSDELFTVKADLPRELRTELGIDDETTAIIDEERRATATYRTVLPKSEVRAFWAYGAPISTGNAYWLMAREVDGAAPDVKPDTPPDLDAAGMEAAARALDNELQARLPAFVRALGAQDQAGVSLIVDGDILLDLSRYINALDDTYRRVHVRLVNRTGRLAEDRWRDNILGEGGVYAEIGCPDCADFRAQITGVFPSFEANSLTMKAGVSIDGWVNVAAHIDPLIGGGAGTNVKIEGGTAGTQFVAAAITASILENQRGHRVAALALQPSCERIDVAATTDGRLKLDFGWASLPKVGARMKMVAGPSVIEPIVAFDARPYLIEYPAPSAVAKDGPGKDWTLAFPNIGTILTTTPAAFRVEDRNLLVSARVFAAHEIDGSIDPNQRKRAVAALKERVGIEQNAAQEATDALLEQNQEESRCKDVKPSVAVLLGGIEIGENNEIVKFLRNAWNDIVNGPGPNNEMVKILDGAKETFHQADAIRLKLTKGLLDETGKVIAYGEKAVRDVEKAAAKAAEDARRAAEKAAADAARAAAKAAEDARRAAEKAAADAARAAAKAAEDARRAAEKAAADAARAAAKAAEDARRAAEKAARDAVDATKRNGRGCFGFC